MNKVEIKKLYFGIKNYFKYFRIYKRCVRECEFDFNTDMCWCVELLVLLKTNLIIEITIKIININGLGKVRTVDRLQ